MVTHGALPSSRLPLLPFSSRKASLLRPTRLAASSDDRRPVRLPAVHCAEHIGYPREPRHCNSLAIKEDLLQLLRR